MNERFELKYVIQSHYEDFLLSYLHSHLHIDKYCNIKEGAYRVVSLYWDSLQLRCYSDKLAGVPLRFKARIRRYEPVGESGENHFEIKWRRGDLIWKERQRVKIEDCQERDMGLVSAQHFHEIVNTHRLFPVLLIAYKRFAFFDPTSSLRVTYDKEIRFGIHPRTIVRYGCTLTNKGVLEIKGKEDHPYWLLLLLREIGAKRCSFSKYCLSIQKDMRSGHFYHRAHNPLSMNLMKSFISI